MSNAYKIMLLVFLSGSYGCSTNIIENAKEASLAGQAYAEAANALAEDATNKIIDHDNKFIKRIRPSLKENLREDFDTKNTNIQGTIRSIDDLRKTSAMIKSYLSLIGKTAEGNSEFSTRVSNDSSSTIDKINNFYKERNIEEKITSKERDYISGMFGLAAKSLHAYRLKAFIKRTSTPVARLLVHNDYLLGQMRTSLKSRERVRLKIEEEKLYKAFETGNISDTWAEERKTWIKSKIQLGALDSALKQSSNLKETWKNVVEGKNTLASFSNDLKDLTEILNTISKHKATPEKE